MYVALCLFIYFQQDQMQFPTLTEYEKVTPLNIGIAFEDLHIPVNRSEQIHAWWIPASSPSNKVVLSFHGNASGMPNEKRVYDDARAAFTYLTVQRGVPSRDIILEGHSLGTGPATEMAKEHPDVGGLVLVSPLTSTPDIVKVVPEFWYLRAIPVELLSHNKFDNLSKIDSVHVPVLVAVGTSDDVTIPAFAQILYQKANQPKRLYLVPRAGHMDIWETEGLQN